MSKIAKTNIFKGFHRLSADERCNLLVQQGLMHETDATMLRHAASPAIDYLCQQFSENVLAGFALPYGIVPNVIINHKNHTIPLAVEETSIVAGLCKTAKWIRQSGQITTKRTGNCIIGQIYFPYVSNIVQFINHIEQHKSLLINDANKAIVSGLVARGGGIKDIRVRSLIAAPNDIKAVIHVHLDPCNAMGANLVTQVCEYLKAPIEQLTRESANMCIVSNLSDTSITSATIEIKHVDTELGEAIKQASLFATLDPYRAATSNKGVMNGIDAILIATGNDWRAVEASMHAYAAYNGQYTSMTHWDYKDGTLYGELNAPIALGCVGGVTKLHPLAQLSLKLLNTTSASELAQIVAAVGLMQNLTALHALTSDGIVMGHMSLHINNLVLQIKPDSRLRVTLHNALLEFLQSNKRITLTDAEKIYQQLQAK